MLKIPIYKYKVYIILKYIIINTNHNIGVEYG